MNNNSQILFNKYIKNYLLKNIPGKYVIKHYNEWVISINPDKIIPVFFFFKISYKLSI